jgi:hypothetical protein
MGFFEASHELERGQKEGTEVPGSGYPLLSGQGPDSLRNPAAYRLASHFLVLNRISLI